MPTGLIVSKLVTTVILLLSNVITMFLPNFVQLDEARFYKDMDSLTIFENTLDEPIPTCRRENRKKSAHYGLGRFPVRWTCEY